MLGRKQGEGGVRLAAAHPGLHPEGKKSSERSVILTWDLLGENDSPNNVLAGRGFASDQGRNSCLICQQKFKVEAISDALCIVLGRETTIYRTRAVH